MVEMTVLVEVSAELDAAEEEAAAEVTTAVLVAVAEAGVVTAAELLALAAAEVVETFSVRVQGQLVMVKVVAYEERNALVDRDATSSKGESCCQTYLGDGVGRASVGELSGLWAVSGQSRDDLCGVDILGGDGCGQASSSDGGETHVD